MFFVIPNNINNITDANRSVADKEEELNLNKKRVLLVQKGREDSDREQLLNKIFLLNI
jgi:hypothetical protein